MPYLSIAKNINKLLGGGINRRLLTLVYGEGGSGKTRFCLHACNQAMGKGLPGIRSLTRHACNQATKKTTHINQAKGKACFIDTEGISGELLSLCNPEKIIVYKPKSFEEQFQAVESAVKGKYEIIVLDSLTNHYRQILSDYNYYELNNRIAEQLELLAQYSRLNDCPVLVTTQMSGDRALGGELLDRMPVWIRLEKGKIRRLVAERCPLGKGGEAGFRITGSGIEDF